MPKPSPLVLKSYAFAVRITKFCFYVQRTKREYVLTKQLLKSGTSIGANIEEGTQAQTRGDFIAKLSISLKEAHETRFWLRLMRDADIVDSRYLTAFFSDADEIIRMLAASLITARSVQ